MSNKIPVLDSGYVELIETWGSEERIVEAARMSTNKGFKGWGTPENPGDEKLLTYLYENSHMSPFEMAGMIIEVQAPIFVFREWHRHRTQSFNEMSGRYTKLPDENYVPSLERLKSGGQSSTNKQSSGISLSDDTVNTFLSDTNEMYQKIEELYQKSLAAGVSRELARIILPVGRYSRMRASSNLRNWLHFLNLRLDPAAQYEIREYAKVVANLIEQRFPKTFELFNK